MVFVDFGNPFLRAFLTHFAAKHQDSLEEIRHMLPKVAEEVRAAEEKQAAEKGGAPRPLAAVLDIDEVVLANIHMNSYAGEGVDFHAADYYTAPDGRPWPRDDLRLNPLLPGARELLESLLALGIRVFFITGRLESIRDETVDNFVYVGLAGSDPDALFAVADLSAPGGSLIMCPDAEYPPAGWSVRPFKESRRRAIEERYRICLNVGDQASDLGAHGDWQVWLPHPFYWTP